MVLAIIILLLSNYHLGLNSSKKMPILHAKYANNDKYSQLFSYDLNKLTQYFLLHYFTFHSESIVRIVIKQDVFKSNDFNKQAICIDKINNLNCLTEEIVKIDNYAKYMSFKKNKQCGMEIKKLLCNGLCSFDKNLFTEQKTLNEDSSNKMINNRLWDD